MTESANHSIEWCFKTLGLSLRATRAEIRQAYRDLVKVWHPDRFESDARLKAKAERVLKDLNEAYAMLQALHDEELLRLADSADSGGVHDTASSPDQAQATRFDAPAPQAVTEPINPTPPSRAVVFASICALVVLVAVVRAMSSGSRNAFVGKPFQGNHWKSSQSNDEMVADSLSIMSMDSSSMLASEWPETAALDADSVFMGGLDSSSSVEIGVKLDRGAGQERAADLRALAAGTAAFFSIGSTRSDVLRVQGQPINFSQTEWHYASSSARIPEAMVFFDGEGRVSGWWPNVLGPLRARLVASPWVTVSRSYFTIGSSMDEVLLIQGQPVTFGSREWRYGGIGGDPEWIVYFSSGRVSGWYPNDGALSAKLER